MTRFTEQLRINKLTITPYNHRALGKAESMVSVASKIIRKHIHSTGMGWTQVLPITTMMMNSRITRTAGVSPFVLMYNRPPNVAKKFLDVAYPPNDVGTDEQWSAWRAYQQKVLDELFPVVRETTAARQYKDAQAFNKAHNVLLKNHYNLEVGTHVALAEMKNVNKNKPLYVGRYEIAAVTNEGDYILVKRGLDPCIKENLYHRVVKLDELKVIPIPHSKRPTELSHCCVESIVDKRETGGKMMFRVRIVGFDEDEDLWLPKDLIDENLIQAFYKSRGEAQAKAVEESETKLGIRK
jgi:hypothetical protein